MRIAVYATFLVDALMVLAALAATAHVHPRSATRLLTATAVVVAGSWTAALTVLAAGAFGGLVVAADTARRPTSVTLPTPVPLAIELVAVVGLLLAALGIVATVRRMASAAGERTALRSAAADTELAVVELATPVAFALPGRRGRIVVSTAMLQALDVEERRALLAHERAHIRLRHHLYQAAGDIGAAVSPMLIPVRTRMRYCMERWADEEAASEVGGRRLVARALARAGLAVAGQTAPAAAFAATGVPARVQALLERPPADIRWRLLWPANLGVAAILLAAEATHDLERLFELATRLTR